MSSSDITVQCYIECPHTMLYARSEEHVIFYCPVCAIEPQIALNEESSA